MKRMPKQEYGKLKLLRQPGEENQTDFSGKIERRTSNFNRHRQI